MTPPDGSDFPAAAPRTLPGGGAVLLHGGRVIVFFEDADTAPPAAGRLHLEGRAAAWEALAWPASAPGASGWSGVALAEAAPVAGTELRDGAGGRWRFAAAPRLDVAPEPLAEMLRRAGPAARDAAAFLAARLGGLDGPDTPAARAGRAFVEAVLAAAAERDGFVEILGAPDTGGFFVQGWSRSLEPGAAALATVEADARGCPIEVARFERDDILAPGRGVCLFGKFWRPDAARPPEAFFVEAGGRLLRLDVVRDAPWLEGSAATAHVREMLPRLAAPEPTRAAFRRVCRPRFGGEDTLSATPLPVAAAVDVALRGADGALLVMGWLLDPLRRVERALIKSTANLYARLDANWCPLPRPDLVEGFAADPRFAGLIGGGDVMHGFVAHAPAAPETLDGAELYLELALDDGACLFRPITAAPFDAAERLSQVLGALAAAEPELERIVEDHLGPFLAGARTGAVRARPAARSRPIPLGGGPAHRAVAAAIPFRGFAELQPLLALLAGAPEAEALDLALVAPRGRAEGALARLAPAFEFYGLRGSLTLAGDRDPLAAQLDLAAAQGGAAQILCWSPAALPKAPGWLTALRAEAAALPVPGLLSPALTYEDGSIYFGGDGAGGPLTGYGADRLRRGPARRSAAGAAQIALLDRAALDVAGGFAGPLFGDAFAHIDLAERLDRAGHGCWCSGAVEFWLLDDLPAEPAPLGRLIRRIDAALLARRGRPVVERPA
jgi:hypothetical protein